MNSRLKPKQLEGSYLKRADSLASDEENEVGLERD